MNRHLANAGTAVLICCALVITGLAVRRELMAARPAALAYTDQVRPVRDWRSYAAGSRIGPAGAPVTIVEFSDFQCPYCRAMADRLRALRREHPGEVALVYRHFPLPYHPYARSAARASICADRQGRFEAFHDALFTQDSLNDAIWGRLAETAGIPDRARFDECLVSDESLAQVERDIAAGTRLGITGTPAILVNDALITGGALGSLEEHVARALAASDR
jgi:protein-disulfide isomerase